MKYVHILAALYYIIADNFLLILTVYYYIEVFTSGISKKVIIYIQQKYFMQKSNSAFLL